MGRTGRKAHFLSVCGCNLINLKSNCYSGSVEAGSDYNTCDFLDSATHREEIAQGFCFSAAVLWIGAVLKYSCVRRQEPNCCRPLAKNLWAWKENSHSNQNCSLCVITNAEELLWSLSGVFFVYETHYFSQCHVLADKLAGLLDSLLRKYLCLS